MILIIIGLSAAVVGAFGPMLSPGFVEISAELGITVNTLSQATAWLILTIGLCLFMANPLAKIYGKRPVYIAAIVVMFVGSVWGGAATNYSSFLGSRVFSGFGMAPYEVLVQCTIGDLYFVHERATRIAIWNLFLLTGIAGGALIAGTLVIGSSSTPLTLAGYVIEDLGYQWTFWLCAILFGLCVLGVILLVPETSFRRDCSGAIPSYLRGQPDVEKKPSTEHTKEVANAEAEPVTIRKISFAQSLRVYTGRYTQASFWKIFIRPFVVFWYPAVLCKQRLF